MVVYRSPNMFCNFALLMVLALATESVHGARILREELSIEIMDDGDKGLLFDAMEDIMDAAPQMDDTESDGDRDLLFTAFGVNPPQPTPRLPLGLRVTVKDYSAKLVNSSIATQLDPKNQATVATFVDDFKRVTANLLEIELSDVIVGNVYVGDQRLTRRLTLSVRERMWGAPELKPQLPAGTNLRQMVLIRTFIADSSMLDALRARENDLPRHVAEDEDSHIFTTSSARTKRAPPCSIGGISVANGEVSGGDDSSSFRHTDYDATAMAMATEEGADLFGSVEGGGRIRSNRPQRRRSLGVATDGSTSPGILDKVVVVVVDFTVLRLVEVSMPQSPSLASPLSPDAQQPTLPPNCHPHSPLRSSRPQSIPAFQLDKLAARQRWAQEKAVTAPSPPPFPAPAPSSASTPRALRAITYLPFTDMPAQGTTKTRFPTSPTVWTNNEAPSPQYLRPNSHVYLVPAWTPGASDTRVTDPYCPTPTPGICRGCARSWAASPSFRSVLLWFREPVQLSSIRITELQEPGVELVTLLPWPIVPISELPSPKANWKDAMYGVSVWNSSVDPTPCGSDLVITLPPDQSGINLLVPGSYSQANLPPQLRSTAVGGLMVRVKEQLEGRPATVLAAVRFSGRVLYPRHLGQYAGGFEPTESDEKA